MGNLTRLDANCVSVGFPSFCKPGVKLEEAYLFEKTQFPLFRKLGNKGMLSSLGPMDKGDSFRFNWEEEMRHKKRVDKEKEEAFYAFTPFQRCLSAGLGIPVHPLQGRLHLRKAGP